MVSVQRKTISANDFFSEEKQRKLVTAKEHKSEKLNQRIGRSAKKQEKRMLSSETFFSWRAPPIDVGRYFIVVRILQCRALYSFSSLLFH